MKILLLTGIFAATLLLARGQPADSAPPELTQMHGEFTRAINRASVPVLTTYVRQLTTQKALYVQQGKLAAAVAVDKELQAITKQLEVANAIASGKVSEPAVAQGPVGNWRWPAKTIVTIKKDFDVLVNGTKFGTWKWIDRSKASFEITWKSKRQDTLTLSEDGDAISGHNADGKLIKGTRTTEAPPEGKAEAPNPGGYFGKDTPN